MTPTILTIDPKAKLSAKDRKALSDAGVIVIRVDPSHMRAIEGVTLMAGNAMLRCALETINGNWFNDKDIRAQFARKVIASYLEIENESAPRGVGA